MHKTEPVHYAAPSPGQTEGPAESGGLAWCLNRLRCMSAAEIVHRLQRALLIRAEQHGLTGPLIVPAARLDNKPPRPWINVPGGINKLRYLAAADRVLAGHFDVFALHGLNLGSPPLWNRDPKSGIEAPLSFGKRLNYRDPEKVGDIKYLWEINRHLHLVTLAQAWALSGREIYVDAIVRHLDSWFESCPYGRGPNWSSALEAGLRLINWSVTWQLLGGTRSTLWETAQYTGFRERWLASIYQHARFISGFFSLHSSANNHLIGEAAGLFVASITWPHWPEMATWQRMAREILEQEARLQNALDGVNREQAIAYQQFEIELLLVPLLAAQANGVEFAGDYPKIIERMLEFLASIMDVAGNVPMFGDSDDGVVLKLDPESSLNRFQSSLAAGALIFRRADFMHKAGKIDERTRWLIDKQDELPLPLAGTQVLPVRRAFPDGGYYILGSHFESNDEIRLVADAGPLGYQRIAAHGHADALSFTLSTGGCEFLIDPGTYAYHTQGQWRQYFRGTAAHNTVRVDGMDQSVPGGNFMWLNKARAGCRYWQSSAAEDIFEGWHDGYERLNDPVRHQRRIILNKKTRVIVIEDHLKMEGEHEIELFFHCHEHCRVEPCTDGYRLSRNGRQIVVKLPLANQSRHPVCRGSLHPLRGWVSRHFDEKLPTTTLTWSARLRGCTLLCTEIRC